ncbi:MAG: formate dehydrogenase accessory sulfurtransferase FdhD [Verrucomicrobiota bacterium]
MSATRATRLLRFHQRQSLGEVDDLLAVEEPLEIRVEGQSIAVVMRTPGHDRELAAGFLLSEGVIKSSRDIFDLSTCVPQTKEGPSQAVDVALTHPQSFHPEKLSRHLFTSSSCGICSQTSIKATIKMHPPLTDRTRISLETLFALPEKLASEQAAFQTTGGIHACALFDKYGHLIALREDVGRHNALDKILGWALLENLLPLRGHIILFSGRASFEMLQKAHAGSIPIVAAISAPSSLAVEFARASGQTLAGFLRGQSLNIYTGSARIKTPPKQTPNPTAREPHPTNLRKPSSSRPTT